MLLLEELQLQHERHPRDGTELYDSYSFVMFHVSFLVPAVGISLEFWNNWFNTCIYTWPRMPVENEGL